MVPKPKGKGAKTVEETGGTGTERREADNGTTRRKYGQSWICRNEQHARKSDAKWRNSSIASSSTYSRPLSSVFTCSSPRTPRRTRIVTSKSRRGSPNLAQSPLIDNRSLKLLFNFYWKSNSSFSIFIPINHKFRYKIANLLYFLSRIEFIYWRRRKMWSEVNRQGRGEQLSTDTNHFRLSSGFVVGKLGISDLELPCLSTLRIWCGSIWNYRNLQSHINSQSH